MLIHQKYFRHTLMLAAAAAVFSLSGCYLSIGGGGKKKETAVVVPAGGGQNNVTVPVVVPQTTPPQNGQELRPNSR